jgi:hypothetical protein
MAYSDLNYVAPKVLKHVFGMTDAKFNNLAVTGVFKFLRKYKKPLILMDSVALIYQERENIVLKRWGYDFESPQEKYKSLLETRIKGFPRCFFKVKDIPDAYYRVFYKGRALKICVFVFDGYAKCICYSRDYEEDLELLYNFYEDGKVDIEG